MIKDLEADARAARTFDELKEVVIDIAQKMDTAIRWERK